jgi:hypothetical protein
MFQQYLFPTNAIFLVPILHSLSLSLTRPTIITVAFILDRNKNCKLPCHCSGRQSAPNPYYEICYVFVKYYTYSTTDNYGKTEPQTSFGYSGKCKYINGFKNIYLRGNILR